MRRGRKSGFYFFPLLFCQPDLRGLRILPRMLWGPRFWNGCHALLPEHKGKQKLDDADAVRSGNIVQRPIRKEPPPQRSPCATGQ